MFNFVFVAQVDPVNYESEGKLAKIRKDGNYNYNDFVELSEAKFGETYSEKVSLSQSVQHSRIVGKPGSSKLKYFNVAHKYSNEFRVRILCLTGE